MTSLIFLVVGLAIGYFGKNQIDSFVAILKTKADKVETKAVAEVKAEVAEVKQKVKRAYTKKAKTEVAAPVEAKK